MAKNFVRSKKHHGLSTKKIWGNMNGHNMRKS